MGPARPTPARALTPRPRWDRTPADTTTLSQQPESRTNSRRANTPLPSRRSTSLARRDPRITRHAMLVTSSTSLQRERVFDVLCDLRFRSLVPRANLLCSKKVGWREGTLKITTHQCTQRRLNSGTATSPFHVCALVNSAHWGHGPCPRSAKQTPISSRGRRISKFHAPPASK